MSADGRPVVTVCIPAYNASTVVGDALRSALQQDYADFEILVLDNHSTDGTGNIVSGIAAGDPRVRCVRHSENIGMARNFTAGISLARGEYVQILCADDVLEPGCLASLAAALNSRPEAVFAACGRLFVDETLQTVRLLRARQQRETVEGARLLRECFIHGNVIGEPSAVMFRRSAASRGFSGEYSQAVDLEMWFHLLESGAAVLLPETLVRIRQHGAQTTQANIRSGRIVEDKRRLFRQYGANLRNSLSVRERFAWDTRMASSVARVRCAGASVAPAEIGEVFFPTLFVRFLVPLIEAGWRLRGGAIDQRL